MTADEERAWYATVRRGADTLNDEQRCAWDRRAEDGEALLVLYGLYVVGFLDERG